jgi:uncharacterized protein (TIGR02145 family)
MKKTVACTFFVLITLAVKSQNNLQWIRIQSGNEIPANAVVGGKDGDGSPLFVAHGNYQGNWHPGKTRNDWNSANIEYGGNEVIAEEYEVLTNSGSVSLTWSSITNGNIPDGAVKAGQEGDRPLFACRCNYEGSKQLGKTWQGSSACNIGYGGAGLEIPAYEVLVSIPQNGSVKPVVNLSITIATSTKNEKCLPVQITHSAQNNGMTISYDNNNHVAGFSMNGDGMMINYVVTTDAKGNMLSVLSKEEASGSMMSKVLLTYDLNGRLKEVQEFQGTGAKPAVAESYAYNAAGQLTQRKEVNNHPRPDGTSYTSYTYNVYEYPNATTKNPGTITIYGGSAMGKTGTPQQIKKLTYDDKKNIGGALPGTMDDFETFATNNVLTADINYVNADTQETRAYTYEYNESGYPLTKTYKANGGNTYTDSYTYSCLGSKGQSTATAPQINTSMPTTAIGTQVWSTKNLDVKTFANGDPIAQAQSAEEWLSAGNASKPAWCYYENNSTNGPTYGILYNWFAVADARGLAPKGWHIPTKYEWITLLDALGGKKEAGYLLKSANGWQEVAGINRNGSDSNGFAALPGGLRFYENGTFDALGTRCQFWTATENEAINGAIIALGISKEVVVGIANKKFGYSVRCVKD